MCDGQWHQVSLGVSTLWLEVYVDCWLVERVNWAYPWQGISTDGLLMVGGSLEGFETPFEVRKCTCLIYYLCLNTYFNVCLVVIYVCSEG